jgi:ribose 5-phosphate isomerase A
LNATEDYKREAAAAALAEVQAGMRLGLGTGSTARHLVELLGERVRAGLDVVGVPTSEATAQLAGQQGIRLSTLEETPELDLTIDGADEIGPGLALIKGAGGALLREKIVASASRRMIVIADRSKRVDVLGRFPLSIEVNRFGLAATQRALGTLMQIHNAEGPLRLRVVPNGEAFVTDGGHLILDAFFGRISGPEALATAISAVPGVVEHGLFIGLCDRAYLAGPKGVEILNA